MKNGRYFNKKRALSTLAVITVALAVCVLALYIKAHSYTSEHLAKAEKVEVYKKERRLLLLDKSGETIKSYRISLGGQPVGHKEREGDERTPEGLYLLDWRNEKSAFYKSIHISYPSDGDIKTAQRQGVSPGGMIMIHGIRNGFSWVGAHHLKYDRWTDGCIAVTNGEMDEIWQSVENGTPIEIFP